MKRFPKLAAFAAALVVIALGAAIWLTRGESEVHDGKAGRKAAASQVLEQRAHAANVPRPDNVLASRKLDPVQAFQEAADRSEKSASDEPGAKLAALYDVWKSDPVAVEPTLHGRAEVADYLESNAIDASDQTFCTKRICRSRIVVTSSASVDELGRIGAPRSREIALGDLEPTEDGTVVVAYWPINGNSLSDLRAERGL